MCVCVCVSVCDCFDIPKRLKVGSQLSKFLPLDEHASHDGQPPLK